MVKKFYCDVDGPIVETPKGKLRGYLWGDTYYFLGIRYGTAKRFLSPEPAEPWEGVQNCFTYGDASYTAMKPRPFGMSRYEGLLSQGNLARFSEDCLNLNVHTPTLDPNAKKPVLVWIAGGGFHSGYAHESAATEPTNLSHDGDMVVVGINHRVALLGFFDLSPFDPVRYDNSANRGLEDLVLALQWIRDNIALFGGDPGNITLMGHSGGGCKQWALMQTPAADGLYHKCVLESGCAGNMDFPKKGHNGYEIVHRTLEKLGLTDADVGQLETMPYDKFLAGYFQAYDEMNAAYQADGIYRYVGKTILVNDYFKGDPFVYGFREETRTIPCIIGSSLAEQQALRLPVTPHKYQWSWEDSVARIRQIYGDRTDEVIGLWQKAYPDKSILDLVNYETVFRCQILRWAKLHDQFGGPSWVYLFALECPYDGGLPAHHGAETAYIFRNSSNMPACCNPGVSDVVEDKISRAVINFAHTGDPNHEGLPFWPRYTADTPATMVFDKQTRLGVDYDEELVRVNNECIPWRQFPI